MNEWIRMADGTELTDTYIVDLGTHITVHSKLITGFREAYAIFGDPEKTARIHSWQYGEEADWEGWTELFSIQIFEDETTISLRKAVGANV